jgi:acyl-CoA-binding protein
MDDLDTRFQEAVATSKTLTRDPGNDTKLELYALYKQAQDGDVSGDRPGMLDFVNRAKYDAWAGVQGMSGEEAKQRYIEIIDGLKS